MRSLARETVFKYIFSKLFNPNDEELFDVLLKNEKLTDEDKNFARNLLEVLENNQDKYAEKLSKMSKGFSFDRLFVADKCAIYIGMTELENFEDTPVAVAIDEAVKLSFKYSTEKSTDFVNGILASFVKEINRK